MLTQFVLTVAVVVVAAVWFARWWVTTAVQRPFGWPAIPTISTNPSAPVKSAGLAV